MARAVLIALLVALPLPVCGASKDPPPEAIGIQIKLGASALVGQGADEVQQPPLQHGAIAAHVRIVEGWYGDFTAFGDRTLGAESRAGKTIFGLEGGTVGIRARPVLAPGLRWTGGVGGGRGRAFVPGSGESLAASIVYVSAGAERELEGDAMNMGTVGIEALYQHFFLEKDAFFHGGSFGVRLTFSYYMGGSRADCL